MFDAAFCYDTITSGTYAIILMLTNNIVVKVIITSIIHQNFE